MPDPCALLIEEDRRVAAGLATVLASAGWAVERARTGPEGLRRFAALRPALLVADVRSAGLDGVALAAHIRLSPFGDRVRIVLHGAEEAPRAAALAAGADAYLLRPLTREALATALADRGGSGSAAQRAAPGGEPQRPGSVRVPRVDVLGGAEGAAGQEEGPLGPGRLVPLLRRLHAEAFSGVLEAFGDDGFRAKLYFARGCPAAARSSDGGTGFGQVVVELGLLDAANLAVAIEEGRRSGLPLGEFLLRSGLLERRGMERALREQVLRRVVGIGRLPSGRYVLDPAEPIGLAGYDVHPALVAWRLGDAGPAPAASEGARHVALTPAVAELWPFLDPSGALPTLRGLLESGATVDDCLRVDRERGGALLAVLCAWGLARLADAEVPAPASTVPPEAGGEAGDAAAFAERVAAELRALQDADHYTVLGLLPAAGADAVAAATVAALARFQPEALPRGVDAAARQQARALQERVLEAGRVLGDPTRRAIYDARFAGAARLASAPVRVDGDGLALAERARVALARGEAVVAAGLLHRAVALLGPAPDLLALLGAARHRACPGDDGAGEPELRRALALDPTDAVASAWLDRLRAARGEAPEARAAAPAGPRAARAPKPDTARARAAHREIAP